MLFYRDGRFYARGASFVLPSGVYIDMDPVTPYEYGFSIHIGSCNANLDIYESEAPDDTLEDMENIFTDELTSFVPDGPIEKTTIGGIPGYEIFYHVRPYDYYEVRLSVSDGLEVTVRVECDSGHDRNLKDIPEVRTLLESIREEEKGIME